MIPQETIDKILDRVDIVDFVSEYLSLKKAGQNFKACCPFHKEKTPSFVVSPQKQIYHCFGCGAGGNVISFMMNHENLTFPETIEVLAKRAGVQLHHRAEDRGKKSLSAKLYELNRRAAEFYNDVLFSGKVQKAKKYLKERGISEKTAKDFMLGYAPEGWENLKNFFKSDNVSPELLRQAGLTLEGQKGRGDYDRFRDRMIFPIRNERGKVVAFGARVLDDSLPKYINSPETPIYSKGRTLYGLDVSRKFIREKGFAVIVEGYTDVIIPHQFGFNNLVATSGTALTPDQAKILKRYTDTAVIVFDSDQAGQTASLRGMDILLESGIHVKIADLPSGEDPASFVVTQGKEKFRSLLENSNDLFSYKLELLVKKFSLENKALIADEMLPTISRVNNAVVRSDYLRRLAERLNVHESSLMHEMRKVKKDYSHKSNPNPKKGDPKTCRMSEFHIFALAIKDKKFFTEIREKLPFDMFKENKIRDFMVLLDEMYTEEGGSFSPAKLLSRYEADVEAKNLLMRAISQADITIDPERALSDCIAFMIKEERERNIRDLTLQLKEAQRKNDQVLIDKILGEINKIYKQRVKA